MNADALLIRFDELPSDGLNRVRPLCRRYAVVVFDSATVSVCGASASIQLQWALGSLCGDEHEVLGVWSALDQGEGVVPAKVFAEMHRRGVEQFGIRIGPGLSSSESAPGPSFSHACGLSSIGRSVESCAVLVPPRHRQALVDAMRRSADAVDRGAAHTLFEKLQESDLGKRYPEVVRRWGEALAAFETIYDLDYQLRAHVRSADRTAAEVRGRLSRAILRHGPFIDSAAALDFVALSLMRAERLLDREREAAKAVCRPNSATARRAASMPGTRRVPALA